MGTPPKYWKACTRVEERLGGLGRISPHEAVIGRRQIEDHEMRLLLRASNRGQHLPGAWLCGTNISCAETSDWRTHSFTTVAAVAAGERMLVVQSVNDLLGGVALLDFFRPGSSATGFAITQCGCYVSCV